MLYQFILQKKTGFCLRFLEELEQEQRWFDSLSDCNWKQYFDNAQNWEQWCDYKFYNIYTYDNCHFM